MVEKRWVHLCRTDPAYEIGALNFVKEVTDAIGGSDQLKATEPEVGENSAQRSVTNNAKPKCMLHDWSGSNDKVAEGLIMSSDPEDYVIDTRLGPKCYKVLLQNAVVPDAWLWRPAVKMNTVGEAVGSMIAWPHSFTVVVDEAIPEDSDPKSPSPESINYCRLLHWGTNDEEVVAEGRWQSSDKDALVNGVRIGPKAVKIFLDVVHEPETFLWRPNSKLTILEDCLKSFVAWPAHRVMLCGLNSETPARSMSPFQPDSAGTPPAPLKKPQKDSQSFSQSPTQESQHNSLTDGVVNENKKCLLMDVTGNRRVVAEGRWSSNNPDVTVHFVPLGPDGVRVWVDVVKVNDAAVWRPSSQIECMEDAIGTTIAWPADKVIIV